MGLPELEFELAPEESVIGPIGDALIALGLLGLLYRTFSTSTKERDTNVSLRAAGSVLQDLPAISDGRRYHPTPSHQPNLGWYTDGSPVHHVVPLDDLLLPRPSSPRTRPRVGRAQSLSARTYPYAQVSPRDVADCVRRARRRRSLFAHGRLSSHARRKPRPGSFSCWGY